MVSLAVAWDQRKPPNKRLKLTGGYRSKGSGLLCP